MGIQIRNIAKLLKAKILTPGLNLMGEVDHAFTSDLMSDVLTGDYDKTVLITGLSNLQAIRTAEIADIREVIIGRNKKVSPEMVELAFDNDIVLLQSSYSLYKISGILYGAGVKPIY